LKLDKYAEALSCCLEESQRLHRRHQQHKKQGGGGLNQGKKEGGHAPPQTTTKKHWLSWTISEGMLPVTWPEHSSRTHCNQIPSNDSFVGPGWNLHHHGRFGSGIARLVFHSAFLLCNNKQVVIIIKEKMDRANLGISLCPLIGHLLIQNRSHSSSLARRSCSDMFNPQLPEWRAEHQHEAWTRIRLLQE
jgi:hypothetical protein